VIGLPDRPFKFMRKDNNKIKYLIYCRKSSESEDRQVLSIDSQKNELKELAKNLGLSVIGILEESQSAKAPGRPVFNQLLQRISTGEAQGIICWKLDRLARNPIDGGSINWLLQQGTIKHIKTFDKDHYPFDNVLMMSVEFGMANQFVLDLSKNTKRGLSTKVKMGWRPGVAPLGYLNNKIDKTIEKDPERFDLIKKVWDLMLSEKHNVSQVFKILNNKYQFKTRRMKRQGGKPISISMLYSLFNNPFYYGWFEYQDELHKGSHEKMITEEEFNKVQLLLGRKGKRRPKGSHIFPFTGLIRCGECGAGITAENKVKHQKNGNVHHYTYYHCTKRKDPNCSQGSIRSEELEKQINDWLSKIEINEKYKDIAIKHLNKRNKQESNSNQSILKSQEKEYKNCLKKLHNLLGLKISPGNSDGSLLSDEEYREQKAELIKEKTRYEELLNDTGQKVEKWIAGAEEAYNFACLVRAKFTKGDVQTKRTILSGLGQNLLLKDGKLSLNLKEPFKIIENTLSFVPQAKVRLEPVKIALNKHKNRDFVPALTTWLRG